MNGKPLIVIGVSARAAAFSAHRAGYAPYWIDHFGDEDLREQFSGQAAPDYPDGLVECLRQAPDAPFMFTGALENHPGVLEQLARLRPLLGNASHSCLQARDPAVLGAAWCRNNIPGPEMLAAGAKPPPDRNWLAKPVRGAGGMGIRPYDGEPVGVDCYLQERIPGPVFSAVFIGARQRCRLLGVTRQLVGLPEFHAGPFSYCGSIGPMALSASERTQWQALGAVLSREFALTGLFGVDAVKHGDGLCPVEVNPQIHRLCRSPGAGRRASRRRVALRRLPSRTGSCRAAAPPLASRQGVSVCAGGPGLQDPAANLVHGGGNGLFFNGGPPGPGCGDKKRASHPDCHRGRQHP